MIALDILTLVFSFFFGMCVVYFTAYSKAKRKNRELQEAISCLEREKQKALVKYVAEKEKYESPRSKQRNVESTETKKQWDSPPSVITKPRVVKKEKREYRYDEKRHLFVNYFTLLDEFHRKNNEIFTLQFHPIMNRFLASNSAKDKTARNSAIAEFNREVQALFNQLYDEQQKVISETDCIRSLSSETQDGLLDKLESAVKQSTDDAAEVLKFMATPELWADRSLTAPLQKAENSVQMVLTCRNTVRSRMKVELSEIKCRGQVA
jgi:hypothetical protein